ncbi:MAG: 1,4-alpha-glucan branching enzyme, partial [Candidatus Electrothrix sp. AUS4]|nr:1,4-alpha-glucan branching enzyme [Candidatus Electrothrix sp. AUS4]
VWFGCANLRAYLGFMWSYSGKKLLFMGCEFGQWQEWNNEKGLEWDALTADTHQGVQRYVADLNTVYRSEPALYENDYEWSGFSWINANDSDNSVFSFIRKAKKTDDFLVVICNFTPVIREKYRIGVPRGGRYREIINSDLAVYQGSGVCNKELHTVPEQSYNMDHSLMLTLPPLATLILKPE